MPELVGKNDKKSESEKEVAAIEESVKILRKLSNDGHIREVYNLAGQLNKVKYQNLRKFQVSCLYELTFMKFLIPIDFIQVANVGFLPEELNCARELSDWDRMSEISKKMLGSKSIDKFHMWEADYHSILSDSADVFKICTSSQKIDSNIPEIRALKESVYFHARNFKSSSTSIYTYIR